MEMARKKDPIEAKADRERCETLDGIP